MPFTFTELWAAKAVRIRESEYNFENQWHAELAVGFVAMTFGLSQFWFENCSARCPGAAVKCLRRRGSHHNDGPGVDPDS